MQLEFVWKSLKEGNSHMRHNLIKLRARRKVNYLRNTFSLSLIRLAKERNIINIKKERRNNFLFYSYNRKAEGGELLFTLFICVLFAHDYHNALYPRCYLTSAARQSRGSSSFLLLCPPEKRKERGRHYLLHCLFHVRDEWIIKSK